MIKRCLVAIALQIAWANAVSAAQVRVDQGLVGKRVVQKFVHFVLNDNGEPIERSGKAIDSYRVEQTDGPLLLLRAERERFSGWVPADEIVPVEQGIVYFSGQIGIHPRDAFLRAMRAFLWRDKGKFDNALSDDNQAIELEPKNPANHCNRGFDRHSRKEYDAAIGDFDHAIRLDPTFTLAHIGRGMSHSSTKKYTEAIADFSEAIWLDPLSVTAYFNRGLAWQSKNEYAKAVIDYNLAIRLDPRHVLAYCQRGLAWAAQKKYDEAFSDYDEAIRLDPRCHEAYTRRAWLMASCPDGKLRDGKKAVESARKACELTGWRAAPPLEALAAACAEVSDFESAVTWQTLADALHVTDQPRSIRKAPLDLYRNRKPYRENEP
jgi:tetratricopeptide (TPR) repeat protein